MDRSEQVKQSLLASTIFFFGVPLIIVFHELAHLLTAIFLGYQVSLTSANVTMPAQEGLTDLLPMLAIGIAGPMVEATLAVTGVIALWACKKKDRTTPRPFVFWTFTLFALAGLRWLKVACDGIFSDEAKISQALGLPYWAIPSVMIVPSVLVLTIIIRVHFVRRTIAPLLIGFAAGVGSVVLWLKYLGPAIFSA